MSQRSESGILRGTPFKFLDYFEDKQEDSVRFAGREQDIAEVVSRALADRTFVLYGRSGLGKTSLLLAGVFPQFRERGYFPLHVRLLGDPLSDLQKSLAGAAAGAAGDGAIPSDLVSLVGRLPGDAGVLLAFDQFEEFFIRNRADPDTRRAFIRRVVDLIERSPRHLRVLFSLREDFLAEMDEFSADYPEILGNLYRLRPLTAFGARQAIIAPLLAANIKFSEQLIRKLVDFLAKELFDPLVLQIVCNEVYREAIKKDRFDELREEDLDQIGGMEKLFDRYLKYAIANVDPGVIVLSRAVLDALISSEGTKRTVTIDDLFANEDFRASKDELQRVLDFLKARKLVREESRNGRLWYELSHDRLAPAIIKWFNDDEQFAEFRDARNFVSAGLRDEFRTRLEHLLSASQFSHVSKYRDRLRLVGVQQEFMFWSAVAIRAEPEDLQYWAGLLPGDTVVTTLQKLIKDEEQQVRLGAVSALPALPEAGRKLATECVSVALDDKVTLVRRAAGQSLAALDSRAEMATIKARLMHKGRKQAVEILGDFYDAGKSIEGLPFWWRWLGRRESRSRAMETHRQSINGRARRGAAVGVLAGLLWSIVIGLPLVATTAWSTWDLRWKNTVAVNGAYLTLAAIIGGLYFGRKISKLTGKQAAVSRDGRWLLAGWKDWMAPLLLFMALLVADIFKNGEEVLLALGFTFVAAVYLAVLRPTVWPKTQRWLIVLMGLAAGLVPMAAVVALLAAAPAWLDKSVNREVVVLIGGFLSFLSCTRVMALAETTQALPIGTPRPVPNGLRRITQVAVGLAALAVFPLHVSTFGTPWRTLSSEGIDAAQSIPLPPKGSGYIKLQNDEDHPQWYEVKGLPDDAELSVRAEQAGGRHSHELEQTLLLLMPGSTVGSIIGPKGKSSGGQIRLEPIPDLIGNETIALSSTARTPYLLKLTRDEHSRTPAWEGTWNSRIKDPPEGSSCLMAFPEFAPDVPGELVGGTGRVTFGVPSRSLSVSYPRATNKVYNGLIYTLTGGAMQMTLRATFPGGGPDSNEIYVPVLMSLITEAGNYYRDGSALLYDRKYEESLPKLEMAAKLDPGNPEYNNQLAWNLVALADAKKDPVDHAWVVEKATRAVTLAKLATAQSPPVANYFDTLAHAQYLSGNWRAARDAWGEVYRLQPGYMDADPICQSDRQIYQELSRRGSSAK